MIELSAAQVAEAVGGEVVGDSALVVTGSVETDSRLVSEGSIFVAKPGEVTDGHLFVAQAQASGAVVAIVEHLVDSSITQIVVPDAVLALGKLAQFVLEQVRDSVKVIGITGSNGKTTTKNMLRAILEQVGPTVAPIESYNNEVGAPISVLRVDRNTRFLVAELGADGIGSIAYLAKLIRPDVAVELKVGLAHVGEFGGIEVTAKIKAELLENTASNAVAVLNRDDAYIREMSHKAVGQILWFGTGPDCNYRAENLQLSLDGTSFDLVWPDGSVDKIRLQIIGEHHVMNALASAAVADSLQVDRPLIVSALQSLPLAERWRMQLTNRADGVSVINDAYNASPDSTKAALQTLAQLGRSTGRRTIAVLGEMAELGEFSRTEHDAIGRLAVRLNLNQVIAVGENAKLIHMGATQEGSYDGESLYFDAIEPAFDAISGMLRSGDIVLVKSSKSANLRHLGDRLAEVQP
ncbi:MAG: UDP-N-acetylmuramoyl-tripeptide--D-alanyl-D-alanine ligase [Micrococcales bacterium]